MKTKLMIPAEADEDGIRKIIAENEKLSAELGGREIKKLIIVPKRLINIIV